MKVSMHITLIDQIVTKIRKKIRQSPEPMTREIVFLYGRDPYLILMSCLLSLQTRDVVTLPVSIKLFEKIRTPEQMLDVSLSDLEQIIKPINYYKTKALRLRAVSNELLARYGGSVPSNLSDLQSIKGIGLKTANLVLAEAFGVPAICVDTHVHRLSNHWDFLSTKTPEQTEIALRAILPQEYWIEWNYLLVKWGQNVCKKNKLPCESCVDIIEMIKNHKK